MTMDLIGEGIMLGRGEAFVHFIVFGGGRSAGLEKLSGGGRSVADLAVGSGRGGD